MCALLTDCVKNDRFFCVFDNPSSCSLVHFDTKSEAFYCEIRKKCPCTIANNAIKHCFHCEFDNLHLFVVNKKQDGLLLLLLNPIKMSETQSPQPCPSVVKSYACNPTRGMNNHRCPRSFSFIYQLDEYTAMVKTVSLQKESYTTTYRAGMQ